MYAYSGKFTPNDALVGTWVWAVWPNPNNPGQVDKKITDWLKNKLDSLPIQVERPKDTLKLSDGGKASSRRFFRDYFWSGNWLIGINSGEAVKMELRTYHGVDFLIIEKGGFTPSDDDDGLEGVPDNFHCGYHVYIRKK